MPLLPNIQCFQIVVEGRVLSSSGQLIRVLNGFVYAQVAGQIPFLGKTTLATDWHDSIWLSVAALLHTDYHGFAVYVKDLNDVSDTLTPTIVPASGGTSGSRLPTRVTVFMRYSSALRGLWYRGFKQFAPIGRVDVSGDELTSPGYSRWSASSTVLAGNLIQFGSRVWKPVILSRLRSQLDILPIVLDGAFVTSVRTNYTLSTWRHRRERSSFVGEFRAHGGALVGGISSFATVPTGPRLFAQGGSLGGGSAGFTVG